MVSAMDSPASDLHIMENQELPTTDRLQKMHNREKNMDRTESTDLSGNGNRSSKPGKRIGDGKRCQWVSMESNYLSESFCGRPDRETLRQVIGPFNYAWPATTLSLSLIPFSPFVSTHKLDSENSDLLLLQIALVVFSLGPNWCFCHY